MNSKFIASAVVAIAALTGANAFAQGSLNGEAANVVAFPVTASNVTRMQVQAEYFQARQTGQLAFGSEAGLVRVAPSASSAVTRAEVRAETAAWVKAHNSGSDAS